MKTAARLANVFLGRLQVFHLGHECVTRKMLSEGKSRILHIDLEPDLFNPHSTHQVRNMIKMRFPDEMSSGTLEFISLSSLSSFGINNAEVWHKLSKDGRIEDLNVFFGNKFAIDDMRGNKHYIQYLADKFGFIPRSVEPVKSNSLENNDISASSLLENPYHQSVARTVSGDVSKYMAELWQTALEDKCLISEVENPSEGAYLRFLKQYQNGILLLPTKDGGVMQIDKDVVMAQEMQPSQIR